MKIDNYFDLLTLHKVFMEIKFSKILVNSDLNFSPSVAKISNQVLDSIVNKLEIEGNQKEADEWRLWRIGFHNHVDKVEHVKNTLRSMLDVWMSYSYQEKQAIIKELASPFLLNESDVQKLMDYIEEIKE